MRLRRLKRRANRVRLSRKLKPSPKRPLKLRLRHWPRQPPSRRPRDLWWRCVVMTDLAKSEPSKRLQVAAVSLAIAAKGAAMDGPLTEAIAVAVQVIVLATVPSALTAAPVWAMRHSVPNAMPWNTPK